MAAPHQPTPNLRDRAPVQAQVSIAELPPRDLTEFIDSLREDELLSLTALSDDFDPAYSV
jgi:hypothetical protein